MQELKIFLSSLRLAPAATSLHESLCSPMSDEDEFYTLPSPPLWNPLNGRWRGRARGKGQSGGHGRGERTFHTFAPYVFNPPIPREKLLQGLGEPDYMVPKPANRISDPLEVQNITPVASYNWKESSVPTIIVPGMSSIGIISKAHIQSLFYRITPYLG
jgi:hypothetical protein